MGFGEEMTRREVHFTTLEKGDIVYMDNVAEYASQFEVRWVGKVVGVDLENHRLGHERIHINQAGLLASIENLIVLNCLGGAWDGYYYPLRNVFAYTSYNGAWRTVIKQQRGNIRFYVETRLQ